MIKKILIAALLALGACSFSPGNACDRYGFSRGTTAYAQCVQAEVLGAQQRATIMLAD